MLQKFILILLCLAFIKNVSSNALDDYVWKEDDNYGWVDLGEDYSWRGGDDEKNMYTGYTLNMTSQRWLTDDDFSPGSEAGSIWYHYLVIIVPDKVDYKNNATLYITGGANHDDPHEFQTIEDTMLNAYIATSANIITGVLYQIPNQHIIFSSDPDQKSRSEDSIITYTWDHYLKDTSKPEWLVRFPMVKACLRAMDTITEFSAKKFPDMNYQLDYYSVSGASKRGWTTYLVGAVDTKRVMLISPIVLDIINFAENLHRQYKSYNGWSDALVDYTDMNIFERLDTPEMYQMQQLIDPYFYFDRLTMPKLIINGVLDEFQRPDDIAAWWNDMPDPKHFMMIPNAEHSMATGIYQLVPALTNFYKIHLEGHGAREPNFSWNVDEVTGEIIATLNEFGTVEEANLWWGYSCGTNTDEEGGIRRDFRFMNIDSPCTCGIESDGVCMNMKSWWQKKILDVININGKRTYSAIMEPPGDGRYIAFMIEITYRKDTLSLNIPQALLSSRKLRDGHIIPAIPHDLLQRPRYTTQVSILPNTYPYADCQGVGINATGTTCTKTLR